MMILGTSEHPRVGMHSLPVPRAENEDELRAASSWAISISTESTRIPEKH